LSEPDVGSTGISIRSLLPESLSGIEQALKTEVEREAQGRAGIPSFAWKIAGREAAQALHDALSTDAVGLLARGWCFARELHQYKDRAKYPPAQKNLVFLGEHKVATEVHPIVTLIIASVRSKPIRFTLELTALFRVAALVIQDAHIVGVDSGDCSATAQLKYGEIKLHEELKSRQITLPGKLRFESPGLAIV
jgi:hypothetical protein